MFLKLLLLILFTQLIYANEIIINEKTSDKEILSLSDVYIDNDRNTSIDTIVTSDILFTPNNKTNLSFGYAPDFEVWIKFKLTNETDKTLHKTIEYDNPLTTHIEFYNYKNNRYNQIDDGLFFINQDRSALTPIFKIVLQPNESKVFYLKASSDITTLIVKLNIWDEKTFDKQEMEHQLILTLFFGAMFLLAFYNLLIYFFIRDISYLYYVFYVMGITIHHSIYVGLATLYIFPAQYIENIINFAMVIVSFPILALAFLTKSFLQTKQYPLWHKVLNIYLWISICAIFFFTYTNEYNNIRSIVPIILLFYLVCLTIYAAIKKNRQAYIVLFGWFMFFIAGTSMYISSLGIYNVYESIPYLIESVLILEALIFSIALTDKIKQLQKKKSEANMELILQKEMETIKLTQIVNKKTYNLKIALDEKELLLKELNHRVKNNMQMIVSLIRLQNKKIKDEKIKDIFITVQNRINAMSHLHELLYNQDNIAYINAYDYFTLLIDELKNSYSNNINIILSIKTDLKVEQSVYCGLVVNELITNSFKYAFKNKEGDITISLEKKDDNYQLTVSDNGVGYTQEKETNTLGLILVNTLSTEQLDGNIEIDSTNGVKVQIQWK